MQGVARFPPLPFRIDETCDDHPSPFAPMSRRLRSRHAAGDAPFFPYAPGVKVPRDVRRVRVRGSVTVIPNDAFAHCRLLKQIVFPDGLREIGAWAFDCCVSLERVDFPSTLRKIGRSAFLCCTSLREVELPAGLAVLGPQASRHANTQTLRRDRCFTNNFFVYSHAIMVCSGRARRPLASAAT